MLTSKAIANRKQETIRQGYDSRGNGFQICLFISRPWKLYLKYACLDPSPGSSMENNERIAVGPKDQSLNEWAIDTDSQAYWTMERWSVGREMYLNWGKPLSQNREGMYLTLTDTTDPTRRPLEGSSLSLGLLLSVSSTQRRTSTHGTPCWMIIMAICSLQSQ